MANIVVVIPVWNEEENIGELCKRLTQVWEGTLNHRFRTIFVDDGSSDKSSPLLRQQCSSEPRFEVLHLTRNFGHQAAITAGLVTACQGDADAIILMDGDLQDPPELIPELIECWENGAEVVMAQRRSRKDRGFRGLAFWMFHRFFQSLIDFPIPRDSGVFGLLSICAARELSALPERNRFLPGMRAWIGFDQRSVFYDRDERVGSAPKQSFARLVQYALNGIFSFSYLPLRILTTIGFVTSLAGGLLGLFFVYKRLSGIEEAAMGFTTLVTLILFVGGLQLLALGILGEYLGRVYDEAKNRPLYIIKRKTKGKEKSLP